MESFKSNARSYPPVSIIIINYNGYKWLRMFLPFLVRTEYPDFEIIIVDNASNDQSIRYLKEHFRNIKIVELKQNKGFAEGCNLGAIESTGDIIAFINNDIQVRHDWLLKAVSTLTSNKMVAAVQCKIMQYAERDKIDVVGLSVDKYGIVHMIGHNEIDIGQFEKLSEIGACSGGAMIIWKDIFFELGCFDPIFFMYYEDIDLSWRIKMSGYKILADNSSVVFHIGSGSADVRSPSIAYYLVRNHLYCWLKNSRLRVLVLNWPVLLSVLLGWSFFPLITKYRYLTLSHLKGVAWIFAHSVYIAKQRKKNKNLSKGREFRSLFMPGYTSGSTNLPFAVRRYKERIRRVLL